ncbi:MAG: D-alanyl-D-alanine carboxypeptidase [Candidatus Magasanikbacteria bacterium]|nr:D-alanyl-D-alanine carboxypeptidase [Candidatus Magasanikbacteria bacterium]MCA9390912.1 D-alanyl-D-alanine carboxypeptidase [Candidatus Magasanikbacteria bacterium]USN52899.1 MAG: D-alanyl-D-alanine carboxypeptidase [Candidatus Nomurabacteria bacterium]HPF95288.1 serine hydrolase [bacterium]
MTAETLLFLVGSLAFSTVQTQAPETVTARLPIAKYVSVTANTPVKRRLESIGVDVTAKSAVVVDLASGEVLFSKDSDVAYPIASLSKLVSIVTLLDMKVDLDETITLKKSDAGYARSIFFEGETFTRRELIKAMLVGSSNEAANALARTSPGGYDAFIAQMRVKAREIGMRRGEFYDAAGLDPRNKATALDIALALKKAMSYPEVREAMSMQSVELKNTIGPKPYKLAATNLLLTSDLNKGDYKIIAAKTGTLPEAGYCFAQATKEGEKTIISVVLGSETHFSRFQDVKAMTYWTFGAYEWPKQTVKLY